jgi:hypothetical protein
MRNAALIAEALILLILSPGRCNPGAAFAEVRVIDSRPGGLSLLYRADGLDADSLSDGNRRYIRFSCEEHSLHGLPGAPCGHSSLA